MVETSDSGRRRRSATLASAAASSVGLMSPFLGQPLEDRHLLEETALRLGPRGDEDFAGAYIRHDARLGSDLGAALDVKMPGQRSLTADLDEIIEHGRSGYA